MDPENQENLPTLPRPADTGSPWTTANDQARPSSTVADNEPTPRVSSPALNQTVLQSHLMDASNALETAFARLHHIRATLLDLESTNSHRRAPSGPDVPQLPATRSPQEERLAELQNWSMPAPLRMSPADWEGLGARNLNPLPNDEGRRSSVRIPGLPHSPTDPLPRVRSASEIDFMLGSDYNAMLPNANDISRMELRLRQPLLELPPMQETRSFRDLHRQVGNEFFTRSMPPVVDESRRRSPSLAISPNEPPNMFAGEIINALPDQTPVIPGDISQPSRPSYRVRTRMLPQEDDTENTHRIQVDDMMDWAGAAGSPEPSERDRDELVDGFQFGSWIFQGGFSSDRDRERGNRQTQANASQSPILIPSSTRRSPLPRPMSATGMDGHTTIIGNTRYQLRDSPSNRGNTPISQASFPRRVVASSAQTRRQVSNRAPPPRVIPPPATSSTTQQTRRRGWARLNADGDEISTSDEEEVERLRQEDLNRNRNNGIQSEATYRIGTLASGSLSRPARRIRLERMEYLVPTTRTTLTAGSGADDDHHNSSTLTTTGRVRLPTPLARRDPDAVQTQLSSAWGEQDGSGSGANGNGGGSGVQQEAGLVYGAATPYYVNPLPMPLEEMLDRPLTRKTIGKGKIGQKGPGDGQKMGMAISGRSEFAAR